MSVDHILAVLFLVFVSRSLVSASSSLPSNLWIAKPNCESRCGDISIPYPFGLTKDCYLNVYYSITCNKTSHPPKAFLINGTIEVSSISLDGQLRVHQYLAHDCYARNGSQVFNNDPWIQMPDKYYTVNSTANKFTIVGCDSYGFVTGQRSSNRTFRTGCTAMCESKDDLVEGSCSGLGCCQTSIPKNVSLVQLELSSYDNHTAVPFNNCSYGFLVEEGAYRFSPNDISDMNKVKRLPMIVDWAAGEETCEVAQRNQTTTYACKSRNSMCYDPENGSGYRCSCQKGFIGNPYLENGCHDVNECEDPTLHNCERDCLNTPGSFKCFCPKGYQGDGIKGVRGCYRDKSLELRLVAGTSSGVIALILLACFAYFELRRRKLIRIKRTFFFQNGGMLLQEKLKRRERQSPDHEAKIFTSSELKKATNNFHESMILGQGGYGIVYKGLLEDNRTVAIKKAKVEVDPNQIEQFINEVIILSCISHKNVVTLLGCCLETQMPLLVYEFIDNGTLYENIHNDAKARFLTWDMRLKIASETANVLSYLHSAVSTPIIHRDVKSANILLDKNFTAKVSDFGTSRLVPMDQTQLTTVVQGTLGYLDPEYMQTNQLTEKSDVYSFGVVLVELLTGRKALSFVYPEEERSLAHFFLSVLEQGRLFDIVEEKVSVSEENNRGEIVAVAMLAKRCLNVKGDDRPYMKCVAMELEGLRISRNGHSSERIGSEEKEIQSFSAVELSTITSSDNSFTECSIDKCHES